MITNRYTEEVLKEFQEQKQMVHDQINLMEPMAAALHKPAATRYLNAGLHLLMEWCCYLLAIGFIAAVFFMNKFYPFYLLPEMAAKREVTDVMGIGNVKNLTLYVKGMMVLIGLLCFIIGRNFNALRKKNSILNSAGKNIKAMASQLLKRKAAIETIEQKHSFEAPTVIKSEAVNNNADSQPNPGYEGDLKI